MLHQVDELPEPLVALVARVRAVLSVRQHVRVTDGRGDESPPARRALVAELGRCVHPENVKFYVLYFCFGKNIKNFYIGDDIFSKEHKVETVL